jgi:hypothetical protein
MRKFMTREYNLEDWEFGKQEMFPTQGFPEKGAILSLVPAVV